MAVVRVLLVDDQAPFLRAMSAVVEETAGFKVVGEAASGEESVLAAADLLPDLVLMDVNLPGIAGLEATRQLRRHQYPPAVLLLSTYDEDAGAHFVVECGAAAYVTKSAFGPDRLREVWTAWSASGQGQRSG
jgi:DNA-binding NarL/FixJ family response regulator